MIDAMKANLFGVMGHPTMSQYIVTEDQENQMISLAKTALSCLEHIGMTRAANMSLATSAKNLKVIFWNYLSFIMWHLRLDYNGNL